MEKQSMISNILKKILCSFKYRTMQIAAILLLYFSIAHLLPTIAHEGLYTISLFIKDTLMLIIPAVVTFFIAHTICSLERRAPLFILIIILFEAFSNFASVWYAFVCGNVIANHLGGTFEIASSGQDFHALWRLSFAKPTWWSADKGVWLGLFLGCMGALFKNIFLKNTIYKGKIMVEWLLTKVFARLIPVFILGFAAQIGQTRLLNNVFENYLLIVGCLVIFLMLYLVFLFTLGAGSLKETVIHIRNLLPAGGIALTSGCSLSTMPWTIEGAKKNLKDANLAKAIIPTITSVHQIGDCIVNTFLCFLMYRHFFGVNPDGMLWTHFSVVFVLARFATVGVIGGAIFVMLPIYETYLHFTPEMIAIILAFNVVLDPIVTSSNVMANGAICRVLERVWEWSEAVVSAASRKLKGAR